MTNKEKAKLTNKIVIQLIDAERYIMQLKEAEDSKEEYSKICYVETALDEIVMSLYNLENQYFQS